MCEHICIYVVCCFHHTIEWTFLIRMNVFNIIKNIHIKEKGIKCIFQTSLWKKAWEVKASPRKKSKCEFCSFLGGDQHVWRRPKMKFHERAPHRQFPFQCSFPSCDFERRTRNPKHDCLYESAKVQRFKVQILLADPDDSACVVASSRPCYKLRCHHGESKCFEIMTETGFFYWDFFKLPCLLLQLEAMAKRRGNHPERKLKSKVARMLLSIAISFAVCWFPFSVFIVIRSNFEATDPVSQHSLSESSMQTNFIFGNACNNFFA